ncbi:MAG: hypothetical protein Q4B86_07180 [Eubacteriales bacterium]|nr:hypothetical protein [Eubacteriales bacterium]
MALFEKKISKPIFKDFADKDIDNIFFSENEHAEMHKVDGKNMLVVFEELEIKERSAHWEAGAKQNFDTGLYKATTIIHVKVKDYGQKPKSGKLIVLDAGTDHKRTYIIISCEEAAGVYRMKLERTRQ